MNKIIVLFVVMVVLFTFNFVSDNSRANTISIYQIPITIYNSQNLSTPAPFQEPIYLNIQSINYAYNVNLIYNGSFANFQFVYENGQTIPAWIENNNSGTLLIWLKLPSIKAYGSMEIYLDIFPSNYNLLSDSGFFGIGENPLLSKKYAEYDDGSMVFDLYDNFAGSSLNGNYWVYGGSGSITVNNGVSLKTSSYIYIMTKFGFNPNNTCFDVYATSYNSNFASISMTDGQSGNSSGYFWFYRNIYDIFGYGSYQSCDGTGGGQQIWGGAIASESWYEFNKHVYAQNVNNQGGFTQYYNYNNQTFDYYITPVQVFYGFGINYKGFLNVSFVRVRSISPYFVNPSYSFGVIAHVSYNFQNNQSLILSNNTTSYNSTFENLQFNSQYFSFIIDASFIYYLLTFLILIFIIFMAVASVRGRK